MFTKSIQLFVFLVHRPPNKERSFEERVGAGKRYGVRCRGVGRGSGGIGVGCSKGQGEDLKEEGLS